jgi:hypothetical protein
MGYAAMPFISAGTFLWISYGRHFLTAEFWQNVTEFINYFLSGFGVTPIYESLQNHHFLASLMGFVIPLAYVLTMIIVGSLCFLNRLPVKHLFVVIVCVYGLGLYHYYVARSAVTSYYVVSFPYVFVLCYWFYTLLPRVPLIRRQKYFLGVVGVAFYALVTNHSFLSYPNMFNFSRNPIVDSLVAEPLPNHRPYFNHLFYEYPDAFKLPRNSLGEVVEDLRVEKDFGSDDALVQYYRREFNFSEDAALIERLTDPSQKVALVSSFEIGMLMQANRKPFFYYFPLVISRPLRMRMFPVTSLYTTRHLRKTIGQLETQKPEYIFMERIFLTRDVPRAYFYDSPGMMGLLEYVLRNYQPSDHGKYLVAMKRVERAQGSPAF